MFLAIICESYCEETENNEKVLLKLPPILAPYKVAILPLVKKDNLPKIAKQIFNKLNKEFNCYYEEKDSIGKRYRRQDAIGTPFCITVDHNTLEDDSVTFRNRDDIESERVKIEFLNEFINKKLLII